MTACDLARDLAAARAECRAAAETMLSCLERILGQAALIEAREPVAAEEMRAAGLEAMEACAFQDVVGQILTRIGEGRSRDPLLQGPAVAGGGLAQDEVDRLMASA